MNVNLRLSYLDSNHSLPAYFEWGCIFSFLFKALSKSRSATFLLEAEFSFPIQSKAQRSQ